MKYIKEKDYTLFKVLKIHTCKNAREIAHQIWKDGDEDGILEELHSAIDRCESGNGTVEDWDLLIGHTGIYEDGIDEGVEIYEDN